MLGIDSNHLVKSKANSEKAGYSAFLTIEKSLQMSSTFSLAAAVMSITVFATTRIYLNAFLLLLGCVAMLQ